MIKLSIMQTSIFRKIGLLLIVAAASFTSSFAQTFKISPNGTVNLCSGQTLAIEASSGFVKYSWSNRATTRVIKVTTSGTYICTHHESDQNHQNLGS